MPAMADALAAAISDSRERRQRFVLASDVSLAAAAAGRVRIVKDGARSLEFSDGIGQLLMEFLRPRAALDACRLTSEGLSPGQAEALIAQLAQLQILVPCPEEGKDEVLSQHLLETVLDPALTSVDAIATIAARLSAGEVCVIEQAFQAQFATDVHRALMASDAWRPHESFSSSFAYHHHNLYDPTAYPTELKRCEALFGSVGTRRWMSALSGKDCMGPLQLSASWYMPGDYSLPHDDVGRGRTVAFVWHLTRDWDTRWGGDFFWCSPPVSTPPRFNSLVLFPVVLGRSMHFVCPVAPIATGRRLTINGWWTGTQGAPDLSAGGAGRAAFSQLPRRISPRLAVIPMGAGS
jgi:Rps23 Pro-64 3,4-dihydroxylase Tpa1-like proline 4-hydroxylase